MLQVQPVRKEAAEHQRVGSGVASARPRFPGAHAARSPRPVGSLLRRFPPSEAFLRPRARAALAAPAGGILLSVSAGRMSFTCLSC